MFEHLSLAHPALLWGLAAAGAPLLIHLLLRPRPRRLRFPALPLMRAALASGRRASRMRHVLLLLLRVAVVALAVLVLAGPTCTPRGASARARGPIACAIVVDDSLSLEYRPRFDEPATLLDALRSRAWPWIEEPGGWEPDTLAAVIYARPTDPEPALTSNPGTVARDLRGGGSGVAHARPLGTALRTAARLLAGAPDHQPRIMVLTDGTAAAWRDVTPDLLSTLREVDVDVLVPGAGTRANLALVAADAPGPRVPAEAPVRIRALVEAQGAPGQAWLVARDGDRVLNRIGPIELATDSRQEITLPIVAAPVGPQALTLEVEPTDLLAADQSRALVWEAAQQPRTWLVTPAEPEADLTTLILANLLAPEGLPAADQRTTLERVDPEHVVQRAADADPPALIVVSSGELGADVVARLQRGLEAGSTVLLVPAAARHTPDWPGLRELLAPVRGELADEPDGIPFRWGASDPVLGPDILLELTRCRAYVRLLLPALHPETTTHAEWSDGRPAIVGRAVGRGRLLLLGTSPDPAWSDLGVRAAGLLSWLHALIEQAQGAPAAVAQFSAGEVTRHRFATLPAEGQVRVQLPRGRERLIRLHDGTPEVPWPTEPAGLYAIWPERGGPPARYAVNWPAEELDPTPVARDELVRRLGTERIRLEPGGGSAPARGGWRDWFGAGRNGAGLLGLALAGLFLAELVAATRGRRGGSELVTNGAKKEPA